MVFDHSVPDIDRNDFQKQDWSNTLYASEKGELTIGWFWSCSSLYTYTSHMEYNSYNKELSSNPLLLLLFLWLSKFNSILLHNRNILPLLTTYNCLVWNRPWQLYCKPDIEPLNH